MALDKHDLTEIRTIVHDVVTTVIEKSNEAIAKMFETQNEYIDQRFATQDRRIDERFIEERSTIRSIVRLELDDIRRHVEKLEQLEVADIQEALDEIATLKKRLTIVEGLVAKLQLTRAR